MWSRWRIKSSTSISSAEDLRERLQAGKIYPAERIQTALENFFTQEKLTQLRELAMEEIAFRLDRSRQEDSQRGGEPSPARNGSWSV